jgi:uncharacterized Zn-finger protein
MAMRARHAKESSSATNTRKIKIKPFSKPPSLPPDFYGRTSSVLLGATRAILRHKPLYVPSSSHGKSAVLAGSAAGDAGDASRSTSRSQSPTSALSSPNSASGNATTAPFRERPISREELYKSVEDLCVHKYGAKLYKEIVDAMDEAALESLARLCQADGAVELKQDGACITCVCFDAASFRSSE